MQLADEFAGVAAALSDDPAEREDLGQQMVEAVLEYGGTATCSFYLTRAEWRAKDWLKSQRRKKALEKIAAIARETA